MEAGGSSSTGDWDMKERKNEKHDVALTHKAHSSQPTASSYAPNPKVTQHPHLMSTGFASVQEKMNEKDRAKESPGERRQSQL